jgi:hypothetical protein
LKEQACPQHSVWSNAHHIEQMAVELDSAAYEAWSIQVPRKIRIPEDRWSEIQWFDDED